MSRWELRSGTVRAAAHLGALKGAAGSSQKEEDWPVWHWLKGKRPVFFWTRSCYFTREIELSSHRWRRRMFSLAELPKAVGFFSSSREDDEAFKGTLSAPRDGIQRELSAQLGKVDPGGPRKEPSRIFEKPPRTSVESMGENRNRRRS